MPDAPLLNVVDLCKTFQVRREDGSSAQLHAVQDVSFSITAGRTLALVGESGSGKSTTGRLIMRLIDPTSGRVELAGEDIATARGPALRKLRTRMQIVFQDPMGSLNPRMTVGASIAEPLLIAGMPLKQRRARVAELMVDVELDANFASRYPHELSGGQRQRVAIARALALNPDLIVADEPVSALDASIQAQILTLLLRLQREHGLSYLFISHDLSVVRYLADEVAVMYLGRIVEQGPAAQVFAAPAHPYTRALLAAVPQPVAAPPAALALQGIPPSALAPPPGCVFSTRCPVVMDVCIRVPPNRVVGAEHMARCWLNAGLEQPSNKSDEV